MEKNLAKGTGTGESLKKIQSFGNRMYKKQEIELKESLSKANYRNALNLFRSNNKSGRSVEKQLDFFAQTIEHYLGCMTK